MAQAWHEFQSGDIREDELLAVVRETVAIFPVLCCRACGTEYVQHDARRRSGYCSDRCRYRITKREQRARLKAAGVGR